MQNGSFSMANSPFSRGYPQFGYIYKYIYRFTNLVYQFTKFFKQLSLSPINCYFARGDEHSTHVWQPAHASHTAGCADVAALELHEGAKDCWGCIPDIKKWLITLIILTLININNLNYIPFPKHTTLISLSHLPLWIWSHLYLHISTYYIYIYMCVYIIYQNHL